MDLSFRRWVRDCLCERKQQHKGLWLGQCPAGADRQMWRWVRGEPGRRCGWTAGKCGQVIGQACVVWTPQRPWRVFCRCHCILVCMSAPQCLCCSLSLQLSLWAVCALVQGEPCVARVRGLGSWPSRSADGGWYCLLSVGGSTEEDETHGALSRGGGGSWIPSLQPL